MALKRFVIDGYGQIEPNHVTFTVTGQIEAQCGLGDITALENGMLVAVDKANGVVKLPAADEKLPIGIHYSTEQIYNQFTPGLKNFVLTAGCPRIGYMSKGEIVTTNTLAYDDTEFATEALLKTALAAYKTTPVYGGICTNGAIKLSATAPTVGPVLKVAAVTTMADGQYAVKFQVEAQ